MGSRPSPKRGGRDRRSDPVDRVEVWEVDRCILRPDNPNKHTPEQIELIAQSLDQFGQTQLVVVDGDKETFGEVIAGAGRVSAATLRGRKTVKVGIAVGWTTEQKRAYRIVDNQLPRLSEWDGELLAADVNELDAAGYDLAPLAIEADLAPPPKQRAPRQIRPRCPTCNRPMPKV